MNPEKIGKYICYLRKKNNMTQNELALKLSVTKQAVSKWENGRGIPDIELLKEMSELFHVDLETLLNGEEKKKSKKTILMIGLPLVILAIGILVFFYFHTNEGFSFSDLVSSNESFSVKGVAAYSDEQSSIFLSNITYLGEETKENYLAIECILYEEDGNVERKIGESGTMRSESTKTLNELLTNIEFHLEAFEISCKNLSESSLYLAIHATTKEEKMETYIVPLELTSCSTH